MEIVFIGLSITSSWGNGHATTYRGLVRELSELGHSVLFLEYDAPWYAAQRDLPDPPYGKTALYGDVSELKQFWQPDVTEADLVVVGSYVDRGIEVGDWALKNARGVVAFYDIDTPITLAKLEQGECAYLDSKQVARYDLYLSFSGGPILSRLERELHSPMARPLYCSFDAELYFPIECEAKWDVAYMGTYSDDRQPVLERLLLTPAREWGCGKFAVAGPQYPASIVWPTNVERIEHLAPADHRAFYNAQRFTLNVTRADMVQAGFSPSVRLFEAAACGTPIISDYWKGLEEFFKAGEEILISQSAQETLFYVKNLTDSERIAIGQKARNRVLSAHTARHRACELLQYAHDTKPSPRRLICC